MTKKSNDSPALAPQNVELKNRIISIVCELRLKPTQLLDMRNASYVDVEDALGQLIDEGKLVLTSDRYLETSFKAPALAEPAAPLDQKVEDLQREVEAWRITSKIFKRQVGLKDDCTQQEYLFAIDKLLAAAPSSVQAQDEPDGFTAAWEKYDSAKTATGWERVGFIGGFGAGMDYERKRRASSPSSATEQSANDWKFFGNKIRQFRKAIINGGTDSHAADRIVQILRDTVSAPTEDK